MLCGWGGRPNINYHDCRSLTIIRKTPVVKLREVQAAKEPIKAGKDLVIQQVVNNLSVISLTATSIQVQRFASYISQLTKYITSSKFFVFVMPFSRFVIKNLLSE